MLLHHPLTTFLALSVVSGVLAAPYKIRRANIADNAVPTGTNLSSTTQADSPSPNGSGGPLDSSFGCSSSPGMSSDGTCASIETTDTSLESASGIPSGALSFNQSGSEARPLTPRLQARRIPNGPSSGWIPAAFNPPQPAPPAPPPPPPPPPGPPRVRLLATPSGAHSRSQTGQSQPPTPQYPQQQHSGQYPQAGSSRSLLAPPQAGPSRQTTPQYNAQHYPLQHPGQYPQTGSSRHLSTQPQAGPSRQTAPQYNTQHYPQYPGQYPQTGRPLPTPQAGPSRQTVPQYNAQHYPQYPGQYPQTGSSRPLPTPPQAGPSRQTAPQYNTPLQHPGQYPQTGSSRPLPIPPQAGPNRQTPPQYQQFPGQYSQGGPSGTYPRPPQGGSSGT